MSPVAGVRSYTDRYPKYTRWIRKYNFTDCANDNCPKLPDDCVEMSRLNPKSEHEHILAIGLLPKTPNDKWLESAEDDGRPDLSGVQSSHKLTQTIQVNP